MDSDLKFCSCHSINQNARHMSFRNSPPVLPSSASNQRRCCPKTRVKEGRGWPGQREWESHGNEWGDTPGRWRSGAPGGRQGPDLKARLGWSDSSEVRAQEDETEKMWGNREHSYLHRGWEGMSVTGIRKTQQMQKGTVITSRENKKLERQYNHCILYNSALNIYMLIMK